MFPGRSGEFIWIGTYEGLDKFEIRTGYVTHYVNDPENEQSISFNEVRSLYEDQQGNLWIGTGGGGLDRLNINEHKFYNYRNDPSDSTSLSNNSIYSIFEDQAGNIWIGTLGGGLNRIDAEDKYSDKPVFHNYSKADGLANDVVKGILEDDRENLWISTTNGLSKLNTRTNLFVNYSESDGLQSNVFNLGACCKTKKGAMIFGGVNGFTIFSPDEINEITIPPKVLVTDLKLSNNSVPVGKKIGGKTILDKSITLTDGIELSYKSKVISFEFSGLLFTNQEKIKYAYRLEGLNEIWIETDFKSRSTTYSNLKPGKYKFQVKASNTDGLFTDSTPTEIALQIHPAFYRTNIAMVFYLLLIFLVSAYTRRITRKRMRLKMEMEAERAEYHRRQEVDQMKMRFFTNISHEFRTPLTLLYGPLQKLSGGTTNKERSKQVGIMEKSVNRMLRLVNQLLDFRKMEHGALEFIAVEGDLTKTIKDVTSMFEEIASQKRIGYELIFNKEEIITWYDPDKIEKILINLLSNAFKYTSPHDKISVKVARNSYTEYKELTEHAKNNKQHDMIEEYVCISVTDTGMGISEKDLGLIFERFYKVEEPDQPDQGGTGIGLALVQKLVEMHHGEIHVKSEIKKGSTFSVYIPFGKDYLAPDELEDNAKLIPEQMSQSMLESVLLDDDIQEKDLESASTESAADTDRKKLPLALIVEDDHDLLHFLKDALSEHYRIHTAGDGVQALKSTITNHPEVVISDVMMPQMDGIELTRKIKSDIRISHIPVILLTSKSALEHRLEGLDSGADAYLAKPFNLKNLSSQIDNLLNSRKLLKEKFI
ncbi:MAG: response regulator, partial [Bacteroidales bacterium]|nr:response regulator [Bacteroidales bacterium]